MSELLDKIRSRGHWRVLIRPANFEKHRVSEITDLYPILQKTAVRFRGWDFPHVAIEETLVFENHIGQDTEWDIFDELWRFYQSGQFIHYSGFIEDRLDRHKSWQPPHGWKPSVSLDPVGVIFRCTEIFEFAARLTFTEAADDQTHLEISANGINQRILRSETGRLNLPGIYQCQIENLDLKYDYPNVHLVANARELALEPIKELFNRFGWNTDKSLLKDIQSELLRNAPIVVG